MHRRRSSDSAAGKPPRAVVDLLLPDGATESGTQRRTLQSDTPSSASRRHRPQPGENGENTVSRPATASSRNRVSRVSMRGCVAQTVSSYSRVRLQAQSGRPFLQPAELRAPRALVPAPDEGHHLNHQVAPEFRKSSGGGWTRNFGVANVCRRASQMRAGICQQPFEHDRGARCCAPASAAPRRTAGGENRHRRRSGQHDGEALYHQSLHSDGKPALSRDELANGSWSLPRRKMTARRRPGDDFTRMRSRSAKSQRLQMSDFIH